MKKVIAFIMLTVLTIGTTQAQNFTEEVQKKEPGKGTVTIKQSQEIDQLVNGTVPTTEGNAPAAAPAKKENNEEAKASTENKDKSVAGKKNLTATETEVTDVDTSKKVMTNARKVTGFRVQAYAGGNSREAKRKAEEVKAKIKSRFPNQPVYVHFQSPRWICQVGNCRTQEEANLLCQQIKSIGIQSAIVVRRSITVHK